MKNITVEELKARLDAGEKINLIDCREPNEYAEFNIGGKLVPLGKIQTMQTEELDDLKEEEVIVHCRSGQRSMMACMFLGLGTAGEAGKWMNIEYSINMMDVQAFG